MCGWAISYDVSQLGNADFLVMVVQLLTFAQALVDVSRIFHFVYYFQSLLIQTVEMIGGVLIICI